MREKIIEILESHRSKPHIYTNVKTRIESWKIPKIADEIMGLVQHSLVYKPDIVPVPFHKQGKAFDCKCKQCVEAQIAKRLIEEYRKEKIQSPRISLVSIADLIDWLDRKEE